MVPFSVEALVGIRRRAVRLRHVVVDGEGEAVGGAAYEAFETIIFAADFSLMALWEAQELPMKFPLNIRDIP